jgi:uncharacterized protein (DUF2147 family)
MLVTLPLMLAAALAANSPVVTAPAPRETTVWRNPQNSVHVRVEPCGSSMCGVVIWANEKAKADSARGGTTNLVGTQLFRDFRESGQNVWKGKVFVPDMNRVFSGTATLKNGQLVARGCLGKNLICKTQVWTRVASN